MRCIYCKRDSRDSRGRAHVLPEALAQNDQVLPRGTVCDPCNHYLGKRLDSTLVRYPLIAFAIQFLETPGKDGKPRKIIGAVEREFSPDPRARIRTPVDIQRLGIGPDGLRRAHVAVRADPKFDMGRFRRALHHIAFNVIAHFEGAERLLDQKWDRVRTYIRFPQSKDERWPFALMVPRPDVLVPVVRGVRFESGKREIVMLQLFQAMFIVDLNATGDLETLCRQQGALFVGPEQESPPHFGLVVVEDKPGP